MLLRVNRVLSLIIERSRIQLIPIIMKPQTKNLKYRNPAVVVRGSRTIVGVGAAEEDVAGTAARTETRANASMKSIVELEGIT